MVSMSRRFSSGKALSVSFPYKVAKKIVLAMWFCFTWSFFRLLLWHCPRQRSRTRCRGLLGYNIFVVVVEGLGSAAV